MSFPRRTSRFPTELFNSLIERVAEKGERIVVPTKDKYERAELRNMFYQYRRLLHLEKKTDLAVAADAIITQQGEGFSLIFTGVNERGYAKTLAAALAEPKKEGET